MQSFSWNGQVEKVCAAIVVALVILGSACGGARAGVYRGHRQGHLGRVAAGRDGRGVQPGPD